MCYWESQQVTLELNQTVWTLLYACGWIVISVDFRKVKPLRWSSRVRRNSEKLGNQDRQRKRLDKKAASSANLLTRSPSLEKWVHSHITHHWHYTLLQDLPFFPHSQEALSILSQRTLWWSYWEIALYNPILVNIVQQPIVDTWNGFLICLDFLFPQSSKGTDSEFRWCIFLFCILSWNGRYFPSKMSKWWSCCKGSGLTVFPSAAELQWRSLKSHSW